MEGYPNPWKGPRPGREQNLLRRQVKWLLLFRVTLFSFILGITSLLNTGDPGEYAPTFSAIFLFIVGIFLFSIASAILANRIRRYTLLAYVQILTDSILTSVIVYYSGGSQSIFTFFYFFPVISGSLLLFKPGGFFFATFSTLSHGLILSSEYAFIASHVPFPMSHNPATSPVLLLQNLSVYGMAFYLVSILSSSLAERLRHTEEALSRTSHDYNRLSRLYKQIFDDISSGIITVDTSGTITSFNRSAEEITGYTAADLLGRNLYSLYPDVQLPAPSSQRQTLNITRKDSREIPVGYAWARLNMPGTDADARVYTLQDLSRIKKMEEQVRQSEKMAAIGEIAAGIAHEFRNPLAAISGAAQILAEEVSPSPTNKSLANIITRECSRLEENIRDFLLFSKPSIPEKVWCSLRAKIKESWEVILRGSTAGPDLHLETDIPDNLDCWADPRHLSQIFINLIHNACIAMEMEGGTVLISAEEVALRPDQASIEVRVEDTGCGIPQHLTEDIFNPFFTTRESGTGLGLAIVRQLVEGQGGTIRFDRPGERGTVFTFTLPLP